MKLQASGTCCPIDHGGRVHCCSGRCEFWIMYNGGICVYFLLKGAGEHMLTLSFPSVLFNKLIYFTVDRVPS